VTFVLDYKFGFESQKTFTTFAVFVYFALNTILTYWIWGVERGKVYEGTAPNGTKV
jgi:signal peptidase complex subunit 2